VHMSPLQALCDITVNLLGTSPFAANLRLLQRCCSQSGRSAQLKQGSSAERLEGTATARGDSREAAAETRVVGSVPASTTAGTRGTEAGSSHDQAGACGGVSHNPQVDHRHIREDKQGNTSRVNSCSSSATATGEAIPFRPSIKHLLSLVDECLQRVLLDPAVMGAAHQPAAWMPDRASIIGSMSQWEHKVHVCSLERAINVACSERQLQQARYLEAFLGG
jgi:hypothetical protein